MAIMIVYEKWAKGLPQPHGLVRKEQSGASLPPPTHVVYGLFQAAALSQ